MRWAAGFAVLGLSLVLGGRAEASPQYTMDCTSCHTMPPTDSGTTKKIAATGAVPGNHAGHAGSAASSCVVCHNADVLTYTNSHRNKSIELSDGFGYTRKVGGFLNQTSVPPNPLGTCATAACHSNGTGASRPVATNRATPAWGSAAIDKTAGGCVTCHDVAPATGNHPTVGTKHASYFGTGTGSCVKCHSDHYNEAKPFAHATSAGQRNIEVKFATGGAFAANQCSNLYCHSDGRGSYTPPTWGGTLDCSGCHGTATTDTLSGAHAKHVNNAAFLGTSYGCVECHSATVSDNSTIADFNNHVNSSKDLAGAHVGTPVAGTCSTAYCHSDGKGTNKTIAWSSVTSLDCKGCHGSAAAPDFASVAGEPNYLNAGIDQPLANSHKNHVTAAADCQNCHTATTATGTSIKAGAPHTDGTAQVAAGPGKSFDIAGKSCSNVSCHTGGGILTGVAAAKWGDSLGCVGCHGDASTLSSNAHAKHVNVTTGKGYNCQTCHSQTVSGSSTIVGKAYHGDSAVEVVGASVTFTSADKSCATSCHLSATPQWNNVATGACGTCHNALSNTAGGLIGTNAHNAHFSAGYGPQFSSTAAASCSNCHTSNTAATHADGTLQLVAGFNAIGTCNDCHKQSVNWTTGRLSCESCHSTAGGALSVISGVTAPDKTLAATAGHGKAGVAQSCQACHDNTASHISGVAGDQKRLLPALTGAANTECNYCHQDSGKVTARTLNMQVHVGTANTCAACHDPHGTTNSLMLRTTLGSTSGVTFTGSDFVNGSGTGVCQACHTGTTYFKQGVAETNHPTTGCLDCHAHNTASGTAFEPNRECDSCHGYPPAPRQTTTAVTFGVQGNWSTARFEDYSGGGGAHVVAAHIKKDAKPSEGWANCLPCHFGGAANHAKAMPFKNHVDNVTVKIDPSLRFSDDAFATYTGAKLVNDGTNQTGTCFNVSCHFRPSPQWSIEK
ncbi:MAG TPA: CxxxxCH/CxxCH domain-containing protein [Geobacter sp.]|nr:CxxxxCH/CxxCH domain-containing protein [Geobacter sp.]